MSKTRFYVFFPYFVAVATITRRIAANPLSRLRRVSALAGIAAPGGACGRRAGGAPCIASTKGPRRELYRILSPIHSLSCDTSRKFVYVLRTILTFILFLDFLKNKIHEASYFFLELFDYRQTQIINILISKFTSYPCSSF
ncbi:unnamed protein product [Strongylus vulgaris]|uniref:Uncharacterized protein n=1 Tax=Strongylus vulgaris TaxID=40348 RepID=A0A3P7JEF9_STRVU|nr:unnamed protein product [Strongylus vulgaris]